MSTALNSLFKNMRKNGRIFKPIMTGTLCSTAFDSKESCQVQLVRQCHYARHLLVEEDNNYAKLITAA